MNQILSLKKYPRLNNKFYQRTDVVLICEELIGKVLVSRIDGVLTSGIIVETEAYRGPDDRACHAYDYRRTPRTEIMYAAGGVAYIYLCYGIHHLFNVVTGPMDAAHAVLIRALEPLEGIDTMLERRHMNQLDYKVTRGPGALSMAMGFNSKQSGSSLIDKDACFYIEDRNMLLPYLKIVSGPRIGVERAGEAASWPWRYYVQNNKFVSAKRS